jgi:hypothetical protein
MVRCIAIRKVEGIENIPVPAKKCVEIKQNINAIMDEEIPF